MPTAVQQVVPTEALSICLAVPGMNPRAHSVPQAMRSLHGVLQKQAQVCQRLLKKMSLHEKNIKITSGRKK